MALFTIDDFEDATGTIIAAEDEEAVQYRIDKITRYIERELNTKFEPTETTERCQASYYGTIELNQPVIEVSSVTDPKTGDEVFSWDFDDVRLVFGLRPNYTVDVTYEYGYAAPPEDLVDVGIDMLAEMIAPAQGDSVELNSYTVGDVTERYTRSQLASLVSDMSKETLDWYGETETTIPLGPRNFYRDYDDFPNF